MENMENFRKTQEFQQKNNHKTWQCRKTNGKHKENEEKKILEGWKP